MGFRNPVRFAVDPTARDLANAALTQIIPGSRLAADAIDGKTITGATVRTAAAGQRVELTSAAGLRGIDSTGAVKTTLAPNGNLTAVNATISGTLRTAASGPRIELVQSAGVSGSSGSLSFVSGVTGVTAALLRHSAAFTDQGGGAVTLQGSSFLLQGGRSVVSKAASIDLGEDEKGAGGYESTIALTAERITADPSGAQWPLGDVAASYTTATLTTTTNAEQRLTGAHNLSGVSLRAGRKYEAIWTGNLNAGGATGRVTVGIRAALGTGTPTTASPLAAVAMQYIPVVGGPGQATATTAGQPFQVASSRTYSFHLFGTHGTSGGTMSLVPLSGSQGITIRDVGPADAGLVTLL